VSGTFVDTATGGFSHSNVGVLDADEEVVAVMLSDKEVLVLVTAEVASVPEVEAVV